MERKRHPDEIAWEQKRKERRALVEALAGPIKAEAERLIAMIRLHADAWDLTDEAIARASDKCRARRVDRA